MRVILVNGCLNCPLFEPETYEHPLELYGKPPLEHDTEIYGYCNLLRRPLNLTNTGFLPECPLGAVNELKVVPGEGTKVKTKLYTYNDTSNPLRFFNKKERK